MTYLGFHISKGRKKTLYDALKNDITEFDINAAQIFVVNPRSAKSMNLGDTKEIKKFVKDNNIKLFVHSAYITTMIWGEKPYGIKLLKDQMKLAKECGARGLVLHLPKKSCNDISKVLITYKGYINDIKIKLLFEPPAFKSDSTCSFETPVKLNKLNKVIDAVGLINWGYCIDTAHIWTGMSKEDEEKGFAMESYKGVNKWIKSLTKETRKKIKLIHLNGSHSLTGKDVHAIPIFGKMIDKSKNKIPDYIWGDILRHNNEVDKKQFKESGLYRFIKFANAKKIPMIIEMNAGTDNQLINTLDLIESI